MGIRMAKHSYNTKVKAYRRHTSPENLPERTNNILTNMVPENVRTITTETYEAVDTNHEFIQENGQDIPIPKKDKTHRTISLLPAFSKVMERLVPSRVKWSAQPINPYYLGFRSGVETIHAIATLTHTAAPITALRRGYNSPCVVVYPLP